MEFCLIPTSRAISRTETASKPFCEKRSRDTSNIFSLVVCSGVSWVLVRVSLMIFCMERLKWGGYDEFEMGRIG